MKKLFLLIMLFTLFVISTSSNNKHESFASIKYQQEVKQIELMRTKIESSVDTSQEKFKILHERILKLDSTYSE